MKNANEDTAMIDDEDEAIESAAPYGPLSPPTRPSQVYSVRIPVERIEELRRVAAELSMQPSTLLRTWVLEKLDESASQRLPQVDVHLKLVRSERSFCKERIAQLREPFTVYLTAAGTSQ